MRKQNCTTQQSKCLSFAGFAATLRVEAAIKQPREDLQCLKRDNDFSLGSEDLGGNSDTEEQVDSLR